MLSNKTKDAIWKLIIAANKFDDLHKSRSKNRALALLNLSLSAGIMSIPLAGLKSTNLYLENDTIDPIYFYSAASTASSYAINQISEAVKSDEDILKEAILEIDRRFPLHPISGKTTVSEANNLRKEYRKFCQVFDFTAVGANLSEEFMKYLKQNGKKSELLTLIKLGADEKDCLSPITPAAVYDKAKDICFRSVSKSGRNSLQWLSAKIVHNNKIPTKDATKEAQDFVNAVKTFEKLETKPEVKSRKRRRLTLMGIM